MAGFGQVIPDVAAATHVSREQMQEFASRPNAVLRNSSEPMELNALTPEDRATLRGIMIGYFSNYPEIRNGLVLDPDGKNLAAAVTTYNIDHKIQATEQNKVHWDAILGTGANAEIKPAPKYSAEDITLLNRYLGDENKLSKDASEETIRAKIIEVQKELGLLNPEEPDDHISEGEMTLAFKNELTNAITKREEAVSKQASSVKAETISMVDILKAHGIKDGLEPENVVARFQKATGCKPEDVIKYASAYAELEKVARGELAAFRLKNGKIEPWKQGEQLSPLAKDILKKQMLQGLTGLSADAPFDKVATAFFKKNFGEANIYYCGARSIAKVREHTQKSALEIDKLPPDHQEKSKEALSRQAYRLAAARPVESQSLEFTSVDSDNKEYAYMYNVTIRGRTTQYTPTKFYLNSDYEVVAVQDSWEKKTRAATIQDKELFGTRAIIPKEQQRKVQIEQ